MHEGELRPGLWVLCSEQGTLCGCPPVGGGQEGGGPHTGPTHSLLLATPLAWVPVCPPEASPRLAPQLGPQLWPLLVSPVLNGAPCQQQSSPLPFLVLAMVLTALGGPHPIPDGQVSEGPGGFRTVLRPGLVPALPGGRAWGQRSRHCLMAVLFAQNHGGQAGARRPGWEAGRGQTGQDVWAPGASPASPSPHRRVAADATAGDGLHLPPQAQT